LISYRGDAIEAKLSGIFAAGFHVESCNARTAWRLSTSNLARFSVWSPGQDSIYDIRIQSDKAPRNALTELPTHWNFYAFVQIRPAGHQRKLTRRRRSSY